MKSASFILATVGLTLAWGAFVASCKQEVAASGQSATASVSTQQVAASPKVTKIAFVGKKNACDCTRERVDESFAEMQKALTGRSDITVEKLQVDVDEEAVARYEKLRSIMVLPALYLLEGTGNLVDVLQGEVTAEQVKKAIGG